MRALNFCFVSLLSKGENLSRLIFSTPDYVPLAKRLCEIAEYKPGNVSFNPFPDGETGLCIADKVQGREVTVLAGMPSAKDTMMLYYLLYGLIRYGAEQLKVVIPYFGCSTMERTNHKGEVPTAKANAVLLSTIGNMRRTTFLLMHLHTDGIPQYFEGRCSVQHLSCEALLTNMIRDTVNGDKFVIGTADAGGAKAVQRLAKLCNVDVAVVFKERASGSETTIRQTQGDVGGKHVVIVDDMVRTGSSLKQAALSYRAMGAKKVSVVVSHGVFIETDPQAALDRLFDDGAIDHLNCTDTHPRVSQLKHPKLRIYSTAEEIKSALSGESLVL